MLMLWGVHPDQKAGIVRSGAIITGLGTAVLRTTKMASRGRGVGVLEGERVTVCLAQVGGSRMRWRY